MTKRTGTKLRMRATPKKGSGGNGRLRGFPLQSVEISLPFERQQVLLGAVTRLAGRDTIAPGTVPTAHQRHDMIEGQLPGSDLPVAVMADAGGDAIAPPLAAAQLAGLVAFPAELFGGDVDPSHPM